MRTEHIVEEVVRPMVQIVLTDSRPSITRLPEEEPADQIRDTVEELTVCMVDSLDE